MVLLSIAPQDKRDARGLVQSLHERVHPLYATAGTADMIESMGIPVTRIEKKLSQGHPNVVDVINDGTVSVVVNTVTGERQPLRDGFHIRRAAVERRIPCFTSLDTARAAVESMNGGGARYEVRRLDEYLSGVASKHVPNTLRPEGTLRARVP